MHELKMEMFLYIGMNNTIIKHANSKVYIMDGIVLLFQSLAGISRSTTLVVSYIMTITELPWYDSLNVVRAARKGANPNFGFQRQLQNFEFTSIKSV